jgi:hypothetical protein
MGGGDQQAREGRFQVLWPTSRQPGWTRYPVGQGRALQGLSIPQDRVLTHSGALGACCETGDSVLKITWGGQAGRNSAT